MSAWKVLTLAAKGHHNHGVNHDMISHGAIDQNARNQKMPAKDQAETE